MSQQQKRSINRIGLDVAFETDEAHKSNLILEAQLLREQTKADEAGYKFAEAAQIEENLGQRCESQGLIDKSLLHRFSALSLWAQAGNFYRAIEIGDELLSSTDLPERLRQRVKSYTDTLRQRRTNWYK